MLTVRDIRKEYRTGNLVQKALDGVSVSFRDKEFVAILGPSGSGKTTLLNIIGGLDSYDSGEMSVDGVSTSRYGSRDWDAYRNRTIGFVFQSYNLIPHQTILSNVELAMTLAGVGKAERRRRAQEALDKVGLLDQAHKKPNQLSGGQMQRVAIARALVNEPAVLLADEPTGALDSDTGEQVIRILKQVSEDHLVIMVTHNADLAERYATRVVRLKDGQVIEDSDPYDPEGGEATDTTEVTETTGTTEVTETTEVTGTTESTMRHQEAPKKQRKPSMSFATSFSLSVSNLWSKKARTILVAIATSIGIIGIALILSLSNGANNYIRRIEKESLSEYPLTISSSAFSFDSSYGSYSGTSSSGTSSGTSGTSSGTTGSQAGTTSQTTQATSQTASTQSQESTDEVRIRETQMMGRVLASARNNDLGALKDYFESGQSGIEQYTRAVEYEYDVTPEIYRLSETGYTKVNPNQMISSLGLDSLSSWASLLSEYSFGEMFRVLPSEEDLYRDAYELLAGSWPEKDTDCILVLSETGGISDMLLYMLGLKDQDVLQDSISSFTSGESSRIGMQRSKVFAPADFLGISFRVLPASSHYDYNSTLGVWVDISSDRARMLELLSSAMELTITGVVKPAEDTSFGLLSSGVCYSPAILTYLMDEAARSGIVRQQLANPDVDVLTGKAFGEGFGLEEIPITDFISFHPEYLLEVLDINLNAFVPEDVQLSAEKLQTIVNEVRATGRSRTLSGMLSAGFEFLKDLVYFDRDKLSRVISVAIDEEKIRDIVASMSVSSASTYEGNLSAFGYADSSSPSGISIYPADFNGKNEVLRILDEYNASMREARRTDKVIVYTDYVGTLMSSVTTIIDVITYVLIAFVSVSLVVSSIMIGIITYISVLERRKEIGILRSLGASKRNITQVFNAETFIIGLLSGAIGILMTLLLQIPINNIIRILAEEDGIKAVLPAGAGVVLVLLCVLLTFIGGFIPSRKAARQDPVTALRSE